MDIKARKAVCKALKITEVPDEKDEAEWCEAVAAQTGKADLNDLLASQVPPLSQGASQRKGHKVKQLLDKLKLKG